MRSLRGAGAILEALSWAGLALCVRGAFATFERGLRDPSALYNSDSLFIAAYQRDVLHGVSTKSWGLPHATFVFPDFLLWGLVDALTPSLQWATFVFGWSQFGLFVALARYAIARDSRTPLPHAGVALASAWSVVFLCIGMGRATEALDALKVVHHFSMAPVGLVGVIALERCLVRGRTPWAWALPIVTLAAALSDPFAVSCVVAPLCVMLLLALVRDRRNRGSRTLLLALVLLPATILPKVLGTTGENSTLQLAQLRAQWESMMRAISATRWDGINCLMLVGLMMTVLLFVRGVRRMNNPTMGALLDLLPLSAIVANEALLFVSANAMPANGDLNLFTRYRLVPFVYVILVWARVPSAVFDGIVKARRFGLAFATWAPRCLTLITLGSAAWLWLLLLAHPRVFVFTQYRPPLARCLDELPPSMDVHRGLAEFWNARTIELLAQRKLELEQVLPDGTPRDWLNNAGRHRRTTPPFDFILPALLDAPALRQRFGVPKAIAQCGNDEIWWYAPEQRDALTQALLR